MSTTYSTRQVGAANSLDYKVYLEKNGQLISPFHDIPVYPAGTDKSIVNMVVEIPRWTNAKLEISKDTAFNPIKQDTKKGKLRFVRNVFPHHGYIWNYGAIPQTWEDPSFSHPDTLAVGDNDPLDVIEIGERVAHVGQVKQVKVLGLIALLDEGETDWKIIAIDVTDPLASKLNDIADVEKHMPGFLHATNEWFRVYKIPDGKPENQFAFKGEAKNKAYAMNVIEETHHAWKRLINAVIPNKTDQYDIKVVNTTVDKSPYKVENGSASVKAVPSVSSKLPPEPIDASIGKWFYLSGTTISNL